MAIYLVLRIIRDVGRGHQPEVNPIREGGI
jgi:hypothetical protein